MKFDIQQASIKIGPLECKGKSESMINGGSCQSLKIQGRPTGYYILETLRKPLESGTFRYSLLTLQYLINALSVTNKHPARTAHLN